MNSDWGTVSPRRHGWWQEPRRLLGEADACPRLPPMSASGLRNCLWSPREPFRPVVPNWARTSNETASFPQSLVESLGDAT
jgi:hypothetical protein